MKLYIIGGSLDGKTLSFEGPLVTIGRDESNILHLPDPGVSGRHGFVEKIAGKWHLRDTGSTNGITINGTKLDDKVILKNSDKIKIGVVEIKVELAVSSETTSASPKEPNKATSASTSKGLSSKSSQSAKTPTLNTKKSKPTTIHTSSLTIDDPEKIDELRQEKAEQRKQAKKMAKLKSRLIIAGVLITIGIISILGYPKIKSMYQDSQKIAEVPTATAEPVVKVTTTQKVPNIKQSVVPLSDSPLYIQSYPSGATIEIDGEIVGKSPLELFKYKSGVHILTIYKDGYQATEYTFSHPHNPIQIHTLRQEPNSALITSEPSGSAVTIGGQIKGHTPLLLRNLAEGYTHVTLTSQGYEPTSKEFEITPKYNRQFIHLKHSNNAGALKIITRPPGVKVFMNGDYLSVTSASDKLALASDPLILKGFIPGTYQMKISSLDGSEDKSLPITLVGGEVTNINENLWMINSVITLTDESKIYGYLANKLTNGDIELSEEKGKVKIYKAAQIESIAPASMRDKYGFTEGIEISADRFKPILSTIHDENDDTDYEEITENAKPLKITASGIESDILDLDLFEMMTKYKNTNMTITGKVSFIREGESKFSIVLDNRVECYLDKDGTKEQKDALVKITGKTVTIEGLCLGVRGLDRVVVVNASYK